VGIDGSEVLHRRGPRVAARRSAVLRAVSDEPHVTAEVVAQTVRGQIGSISVQAVYDGLETPTEEGLLGRPGRRRVTRTASGTTLTTSSVEPASGWSTSTVATPPPAKSGQQDLWERKDQRDPEL